MSRPKGFRHSEETRHNMSSNHIKYWQGKSHTQEHNNKISKSLKGRPSPMKGRVGWNKGMHLSSEFKEKLSKIRKGKTLDELFGEEKAKEWSMKISQANKRNYTLEKGPSWLKNIHNGKKSLEEIYGVEKAMKLKEKRRKP